MEKEVKGKTFEKLPISTQTVMAYVNCDFNIDNIFINLPVEDIGDQNIKKIDGKHGKIYQLKRSGMVRGVPTKKGNFRNQITAYIYIINKMITIKVFATGKFHLTGCKTLEQQQYAVAELLNHIRKIHTEEEPTYMKDDDKPLTVTLEVVMVNVDFNLGFDIDQRKLDEVLQAESSDFYTIFETPVNTSVNIKLDYEDPEHKEFEQVIVSGTPEEPKYEFTKTNECPKAKLKNKRTHTFLVFSSSKVIQSGRYYNDEMKNAYTKFHDFIIKNKSKFELKLVNKDFDMKSIKGLQLKTLDIKSPMKKFQL